MLQRHEAERRIGRELRDWLREARYDRHLTSKEMAVALGVPQGTVDSWLSKYGLTRREYRATEEKAS